jgi:Xaa-Pro aminopeptidase
MHQYVSRRRRLRRKLGLRKGEAFLVSNLKNLRYLTGFTGSAAMLVVLGDNDILLSDSRYETQLNDECPEIEREIRNAQTSPLGLLCQTLKSANVSSLRVESDAITKQFFDQLAAEVTNAELVPTVGTVERLRSIKDKSEIEAIRKSIRVNQKAFEIIRAQLRPDQTELEIAHNLEHEMRRNGASGCSFDPIVASGPRAALPHASPSDCRIGSHWLILIDWGAEVDGYASDLTRVLVTAKIPPKLRKIYDIVLKAQLKAIKKIRPGVTLQQVDNAARKVIESAGFGKQFGHGLGHGIGLEIHETPFLSPIHDGILEPGMVITVEPGIYLPGWGGVRIEDDVLVTQNGHEVLSDLPKQLDECSVEFV